MSPQPIKLIDPDSIRLAMIGATPGNGHPYSWSAMFNGYDRERMEAECPFAGIPEYLGKQPPETLTIPGASITHIACVGVSECVAEEVSACSLIPEVVDDPTDVIGEVDAVVIATDIGSEHVERARPFIEAGLPLFIDKPLVDNEADLRTFTEWIDAGKVILSSSCMRYAKEFAPYRASTHNLGKLRYAGITTMKKWETYGIHALEAVYPILGPGFLTVRNTGTKDRNIVHFTHERGIDLVVVASADMYGGFGVLTLCGTVGHDQLDFKDSFFAFKSQLEAFVDYLRSGVLPFLFEETHELMRMVIGGIESRDRGGVEIELSSIG